MIPLSSYQPVRNYLLYLYIYIMSLERSMDNKSVIFISSAFYSKLLNWLPPISTLFYMLLFYKKSLTYFSSSNGIATIYEIIALPRGKIILSRGFFSAWKSIVPISWNTILETAIVFLYVDYCSKRLFGIHDHKRVGSNVVPKHICTSSIHESSW